MAIVILCCGSAVRAENWPEFRGPTGQGLVAQGSLPTKWDTTTNVAWKQPIPGKGWSSPIVYDGKIYLTTAVEGADKDQSLRALCLDAKTGNTVWDKEIFKQDAKAPKIHNKNSHASPTPLIDGERLYVHFGHQGTAALDFDGKILWTNRDLKYQPVHGNGGMPVVVDKALVFSSDGGDKQFVVALDRTTGKQIWKTDRKATSQKKFAFSTPLVITVDGKKQIISPGPGAVCAYDPADGKEIWRVSYGNGYSVIPRPVFGHGLLFISTGYDQPSVFAIRPGGQGDVSKTHVAWKLQKGAPHTPSLLLVGDELFMVSDQGLASCVDAKTGTVHWQERVPGGYSASPLYADGKVYLQNEEGLGVVVKAAKKFEVLSKNPLGERSLASYAAADGALYIRTEKTLYRIQAQ